jgi:ribosome biogenesis protein ENP2
VDSDLIKGTPEITSLEFAQDGLQFAVGTTSGHVLLYDLRRPTPLLIKDHQYGFPIKNITFHSSERVISSDSKIVKIWDKNNVLFFLGNRDEEITLKKHINSEIMGIGPSIRVY